MYREITDAKTTLEFARLTGAWHGACYNIFRGLDFDFFLIYVFLFNFFFYPIYQTLGLMEAEMSWI